MCNAIYESRYNMIDSIQVENSHCEKLLDVKVDNELKFKEHLEGIIKKASKKVNVLPRITILRSEPTGEETRRSAISTKLLCNFIEITLTHKCSPENPHHTHKTPLPRRTPLRDCSCMSK